ncbi:E3 ubiquitin-protein ligase [Astathelohania contejeani]|uniref:E3 ubiquitin-protein ligase n=1 Tax=Astathelohania contejeani TaxID=164912 RepID=A0ABQ7HZK0_9MICR|nr:E3 ubiquitin-protein ligase [Thelohania contejeani]
MKNNETWENSSNSSDGPEKKRIRSIFSDQDHIEYENQEDPDVFNLKNLIHGESFGDDNCNSEEDIDNSNLDTTDETRIEYSENTSCIIGSNDSEDGITSNRDETSTDISSMHDYTSTELSSNENDITTSSNYIINELDNYNNESIELDCDSNEDSSVQIIRINYIDRDNHEIEDSTSNEWSITEGSNRSISYDRRHNNTPDSRYIFIDASYTRRLSYSPPPQNSEYDNYIQFVNNSNRRSRSSIDLSLRETSSTQNDIIVLSERVHGRTPFIDSRSSTDDTSIFSSGQNNGYGVIKRLRLKKINYSDLNLSDPKDTCGICYECYKPSDKCVMLFCNHYFHFNCIKPWFDISYDCPFCRVEVDNII